MCFSFKRTCSGTSRSRSSTMPDTRRRSSVGKKSGDVYCNSSSVELNLNSTSTGSSSYPGGHFKLSPRSSTIGASHSSPKSLSSFRDSLPDNAHIYGFSQIRSSTSNFMSKPLHQSSSSTSWRCLLDGKDSIVTHRRLRRPLDTDDLRDKLALICRSHHTALVPLLGASVSGNSVYLVHERVDGASLSDCLRNPKNPNFTVLSGWLSRVQIASDIADAIDYLHNRSGMKVGFVHNRIKSSSIIVKEGTMNGKLCHLGTAQLCGESVDEDDDKEIDKEKAKARSREVKFEGTRGYMSPEFQETGFATRKSDVYAFGVVLLELVSGQEPLKIRLEEETGVFLKISLIEAARQVVQGGDGMLRKWVDWRLNDSFPVEVVERLIRLGVDCVHQDPNNRPDMARVAAIISRAYLDSKRWADTIGVTTDFTVSLAPR